MLVQVDGGDEGDGGIQVHGELPAVDCGACKEGKEAIETGNFVDDLQVGDDLCAGAQRHALEEILSRVRRRFPGILGVSYLWPGQLKEL